jgi:hypothetical protein
VLISLSHKFIFVANLKTGSTSIERALRPYSEISMVRSEWGKHISLGHAELRFSRIFELIPRSDFFAFGALRDPVDWMVSLYQSHRSIQFRGTPLDTSDMTFEEFQGKWVAANADQIVPQITRLLDAKNEFGVDFVLRFEKLEEDLTSVCALLGVPRVRLSRENASVALPIAGGVPHHCAELIRAMYPTDFEIWSSLAGRRLTRAERVSANVNWKAPQALRKEALRQAAPASGGSAPRPEPVRDSSRPLTKDDVFWAFRYLLGRDPENEAVVEEHRALESHAALRAQIMASEEFQRSVRRENT